MMLNSDPSDGFFYPTMLGSSGGGGRGEGDRGSRPPWKIRIIGFLSNTGPDSLATKPAFNVGLSSAP